MGIQWKAKVQLKRSEVVIIETITPKDIKNFMVLQRMTGCYIHKKDVKDTIINKYVFPYLLNRYQSSKVASIEITTERRNNG